MKNATRLSSLLALAAAGLLVGCANSGRTDSTTATNVKADSCCEASASAKKSSCCSEAKSESACTEAKDAKTCTESKTCTDTKAKN